MHRALAMLCLLLTASLAVAPGTVAQDGLAEDLTPGLHYPPAAVGAPLPTLGLFCIDGAGAALPGSVLEVAGPAETLPLQVTQADLAPQAEIVTLGEDGGPVHTLVETGDRTLRGDVLGPAGGSFFLTATALGLDGRIVSGDQTFDLAPGGADGGRSCGEATLVPGEATEPSGAAVAAATTPIRVLVGIDSAMYAKYPAYTSVALNIFNRAANIYSGQFGQSMSVYLFLVSTSSSTDTTLGMGGSLSSWATYANGRTDKASWDMAALQKSTAAPGYDGIAYLAGRYNIIWTENSGHASQSTNFYQYNGVLLAHEMGHDFEAQHSANAYYYTYATSCFGYVLYDPNNNYLCIGYSSNCQGTTVAALRDSSGRPFCVGSSPPLQTGQHYYVMAAGGYHDPANGVYWDGVFESVSKGQVNACLPNWKTISYSPGDKAC